MRLALELKQTWVPVSEKHRFIKVEQNTSTLGKSYSKCGETKYSLFTYQQFTWIFLQLFNKLNLESVITSKKSW